MAGNVLLEDRVLKQLSGLTTTAPHTPHPDLEEALSTCSTRTETRREKRRREWHENKIRGSREKKQHNQATTPEEQFGLRAPQYAGPGYHCAPEHEHARSGAGRRRHPLHGRTESQWLVIEELKLCAGCLSRTTPPHKPGDGHAPCVGQPHAAFNDAKISAIRKALDRLKAEHRRVDGQEQAGTGSLQRSKQWRPGDTSSQGSQHTLDQGNKPRHRHADVDHGGCVLDVLGPPNEAYAKSEGGLHPFAPLYNLSNSSSYPQPGVRGATPSQCSASQAEVLDGSFSNVYLNLPSVIEKVSPQAAKPDDLSSELLRGMASLTPLLSGLPGFLIEEEIASIEEHTPLAAVIPDCESSSDVPRFQVEDWDTKTKVPESPQENLACSHEPAWKKMLRPYDRSWTVQGLCPSPVSLSSSNSSDR
jgi:hypothetical protein